MYESTLNILAFIYHLPTLVSSEENTKDENSVNATQRICHHSEKGMYSFCIILHIIFNIRKRFMSAYCFSVQSDDELKGAHGYTPRKASQVRLYTWIMWYFENVHAFLISCSMCGVRMSAYHAHGYT